MGMFYFLTYMKLSYCNRQSRSTLMSCAICYNWDELAITVFAGIYLKQHVQYVAIVVRLLYVTATSAISAAEVVALIVVVVVIVVIPSLPLLLHKLVWVISFSGDERYCGNSSFCVLQFKWFVLLFLPFCLSCCLLHFADDTLACARILSALALRWMALTYMFGLNVRVYGEVNNTCSPVWMCRVATA